MNDHLIHLRTARPCDLPGINQVIEEAIMQWSLPDRVKRLALPSYRYTDMDYHHLQMTLATDPNDRILGIIACEITFDESLAGKQPIYLVHGLYVSPPYQRQGIGTRLFEHAEREVLQNDYAGLLVKAQADARMFFTTQGMTALQDKHEGTRYAHRFWKDRKSIQADKNLCP